MNDFDQITNETEFVETLKTEKLKEKVDMPDRKTEQVNKRTDRSGWIRLNQVQNAFPRAIPKCD